MLPPFLIAQTWHNRISHLQNFKQKKTDCKCHHTPDQSQAINTFLRQLYHSMALLARS